MNRWAWSERGYICNGWVWMLGVATQAIVCVGVVITYIDGWWMGVGDGCGWVARLMGSTWGPSGADRWAPCWPHEHCYLGYGHIGGGWKGVVRPHQQWVGGIGAWSRRQWFYEHGRSEGGGCGFGNMGGRWIDLIWVWPDYRGWVCSEQWINGFWSNVPLLAINGCGYVWPQWVDGYGQVLVMCTVSG